MGTSIGDAGGEEGTRNHSHRSRARERQARHIFGKAGLSFFRPGHMRGRVPLGGDQELHNGVDDFADGAAPGRPSRASAGV